MKEAGRVIGGVQREQIRRGSRSCTVRLGGIGTPLIGTVLEFALVPVQKNRNSLAWVCGGPDSVFYLPVLYRVSA